MRKVLSVGVLFACVALLGACGGGDGAGDVGSGKTGAVHFALTGGEDGMMATIVIREIFSGEAYVIDCEEKPHDSPDGNPFCDELIVVPPGVYEVIVQPSDPNCRAEMAWYKIVVEEGETAELPITIVCGSDSGGLDVVVEEEYQPAITDVDFEFFQGGDANKYICIGPMEDDVVISVTVNDPDTACADLLVGWTAVDEFGNDVTMILLGVPSDPECVFTVTLDAQAPLLPGTYQITFEVQDPEGHMATLTFPVHLMLCAP